MAELRNSTQPGLLTGKRYDGGPYIAKVVNHLDASKMGALEVVLLQKTASGSEVADNVSVVANYLPAFFGNTPYESMDSNGRMSSSTQASYGMWFVPPDVGTQVVVIFIEADINRCFWIGCVPQPGINQMVPGLASSKYAELTPQEVTKLGASDVPVLEVNRRITGQRVDDFDKIKKPMHPFALRLASQGLLKDPIRGVTTSSARRDAISNVYGISTPGPVVVDGKKYKVGSDNNKFDVYTEREGGTQFVMDDGKLAKDQRTGKMGITDELVRIRTRTGHQILFHNSADLVYICNSRGSAWIELTSDGKIDIFAADSVSIHTENDFNFRADRDINIEAGRNINMSARSSLHMEAGGLIEGFAGADCNWTAANHFNAVALGRVRLTSTGASPNATQVGPLSGIDLYSVLGNINMYATTEIKAQAAASINIKSGLGLNVLSGAATVINSVGSCTIKSGGANFITSVGSNVLTSALHYERAGLIDMNGPTPAPQDVSAATNLTSALTALALLPESGTTVSTLDIFTLPSRTKDVNATASMQKGWENNNYYREADITSIMRRVPTHEPWDHHENIDPTAFKPEKTDRGG